MILYGFHTALTDATARALVSDFAPGEIRATALGAYHTAIGVADLPAGLLASILWDLRAIFAIGAVLATIAPLLRTKISQRQKRIRYGKLHTSG